MFRMVLALLVACASLSAQPTKEAEFARAHHNLTLAGTAKAVEGLKFQIGHFAVNLEKGVAQPLAAAGQEVGLHFKGKGSATYTSVAPQEAAVLKLNLSENSRLKAVSTPGGLSITLDISELTLVTSGFPLPEVKGAEAPSLSQSFKGFREPFELRAQPSLGSLVALQRGNTAGKPVAWMDFKADYDLWRYAYDEAWDLREYLLLLKPGAVQQNKFINPITISEQPLGWSLLEPIADPFLLHHLEIDLQAEKDDRVGYTATETLRIQQGGLKALAFNLLDVVDPYGFRRGPRQVKLVSVTDGDGRSLAFHHRDGRLVVFFPQVLPEGSEQKLAFRIEGDFLLHPNGNSYWELGLLPWFPAPDAYLSNHFTAHGTVRVAKPWRPITPGRTLRSMEQGGYNLSEFSLDDPVQFMAIFGGNYVPYEETRNGLTIRVYAYALEAKNSQKKLANLAFGIVGYYQATLGEFPFKELNIIQMADLGYGQAPPSMVKITDEAFNSKMDDISAYFVKGITQRFSHEIAHQYWGSLVQMPSPEEQWITESFAEFCSGLSLRVMKGQSPNAFDALANRWKSSAEDHTKDGTIPMANRINLHENGLGTMRVRTGLLYMKGAHLLHVLYKEVGEDAFLRILKSLVASRRWQCTSSAEVATLLKLLKNKDYTPFFQENFWGTGLPR